MNPIFFAMMRFWYLPFIGTSAPKKPLQRDEPAEG
jgi:hypothetical protein